MMQALPMNKQIILSEMIRALAPIKGIKAIALGGSYALGNSTASSDIDPGIYYSEQVPPKNEELRNLAMQFDSSTQFVITDFYEWGLWVNGGGWLNTQVGRVDWLYRNLDQVNRVISDAKQGRFTWDFRQQPPYGFFSVMYLADLQNNVILYDPQGVLFRLKEETKDYPEELRRAIVQEHLWSIEFSYIHATKLVQRGCIYGTVGCMTRIIAELTQVLYALNRVYFATEKGALQVIDSFPIKPAHYSNRINALLSSPGRGETLIISLKKLHELIQEVVGLSKSLYTPKYSL